jgi:hypothetical protein
MTLRLGVLGSSEGNGHPFSFSAIVNGYDSARMREAGWGVIADYLDPRDPVDLGLGDVAVTHAWCPTANETRELSRSTHIPNIAPDPHAMIGAVDGVLIARDDWESHLELALPFLEASTPVFVDKPLTLDPSQLRAFRPYLESGKLMSCSGFRFAPELDGLRSLLAQDRPLVLTGVGPGEWSRYGVHLVEPLLTLAPAPPVTVLTIDSGHEAAVIELADGSVMLVDCLGRSAPGFVLNVSTGSRRHEIVLADRFTAFRRLLGRFVRMIETEEPPIDPEMTCLVMQVLMARGRGHGDARWSAVGTTGVADHGPVGRKRA